MPTSKCPTCGGRAGYATHVDVPPAEAIGLTWEDVEDYVVDVHEWPRDFARRDLRQAVSPMWAVNLLGTPHRCPHDILRAIAARKRAAG